MRYAVLVHLQLKFERSKTLIAAKRVLLETG